MTLKAILLLLCVANPGEEQLKVYTNLQIIEVTGGHRSALPSCETQGIALMNQYPDVIIGYSCESYHEEVPL